MSGSSNYALCATARISWYLACFLRRSLHSTISLLPNTHPCCGLTYFVKTYVRSIQAAILYFWRLLSSCSSSSSCTKVFSLWFLQLSTICSGIIPRYLWEPSQQIQLKFLLKGAHRKRSLTSLTYKHSVVDWKAKLALFLLPSFYICSSLLYGI